MKPSRYEMLTKEYLGKIANDPDWNSVPAGAMNRALLAEVYTDLEVLSKQKATWGEKSVEIAPTDERLEHAGLQRSTPGIVEQVPGGQMIVSTLSRALKEAKNLILLGEAGAGKTTTLRYIGLCFARQGENWAEDKLGSGEFRVPIKVELGAYASRLAQPGPQIEGLLVDIVNETLRVAENEASELVQLWLQTGVLIVLIDGLDEIDKGIRKAVVNEISKFSASSNRVILASRQIGYMDDQASSILGGNFVEFTIKPFSGRQEMKAYLRKWLRYFHSEWKGQELEGKTSHLLDEMKQEPGITRLTDNPLYLRLSAMNFSGQARTVKNRAELYETYVEQAWSQAVERGIPVGEKNLVMNTQRALAWHFHIGGGRSEDACVQGMLSNMRELLPLEIIDTEKAGALLAVLRSQLGTIISYKGELRFSHMTLQDFFAGEFLHRAWKNDRKRCWSVIQPRRHLPEWREPLIVLAEKLAGEVSDLILPIIKKTSPYEDLLHRDLLLAMDLSSTECTDPKVHRVLEKQIDRILLRNPKSYPASAVLGATIGRMANTNYAQPIQPLVDILVNGGRMVHLLPTIYWLGKRKDPDAIPYLGRLLETWKHSADIKYAVFFALLAIGNPRATSSLVRLLLWNKHLFTAELQDQVRLVWDDVQALQELVRIVDNEEPEILEGAICVLGRLGDTKALAPLTRLLEDRHVLSSAKTEAIKALGRIGSPEAIPHLLRVLDDKYSLISDSEELPIALAKLATSDTINDLIGIINAWEQVENRQKELENTAFANPFEVNFRGLFDHITDSFDHALGKGKARKVVVAIQTLGKIGDPIALPCLIKALDYQNELIRQSAVIALGKIGSMEAVSSLRRGLHDKSSDIRGYIVEALYKIAGGAFIADFEQALADDAIRVRACAAEALVRSGNTQYAPHLLKALKAGDYYSRRKAAEALSTVKEPNIVYSLLSADMNPENGRHDEMQKIIQAIRSADLIPCYLEILKKSDSEWARVTVCNELIEIADPTVASELAQALKDPSPSVRAKAAEGLGKIGSSESSEELIAALEDDSEAVREAAIDSLGKLHSDNALPCLRKILQNKSKSVALRAKAAHALSLLGDSDSIEAILQLTKAADPPSLPLWGSPEAFSICLDSISLLIDQIRKAKTLMRAIAILARKLRRLTYMHAEIIEAINQVANRIDRLNCEEYAINPFGPVETTRTVKYGRIFLLALVAGVTDILGTVLARSQHMFTESPDLSLLVIIFIISLCTGLLGLLVNYLKSKWLL